jgi:Kdo2-lipid IVA lauroyltransferase/acyltransferase
MATDPAVTPLSKRKAAAFTAVEAPPLSHFFGSADQRKRASRYWIRDNIGNGFDLLVHFGLKLLTMDACSNFGAKLGPFAIPRFNKSAIKRGRATLARLMPEKSQAERDELLQRNLQSQGRIMTEFSVVNRLLGDMDRITLHDFHRLVDPIRQGPVIIVGMHLGNWEIGPTILHKDGIRPYANYIPPKGRAKAWISEKVRRKGGLNFLPPGAQGTRPSVKLLKDGGVISMFCDEAVAGKIRGPLFGRKPHLEGNLAVAVRLARMTGAKICPWYNLRGEGFRFDAYFLPAIELPPEEKPGARLMDDIVLLNSVIEPVIRANLDQWYFLDNTLPAD